MNALERELFIDTLNKLQERAFANAKAKGFCDSERNVGEVIALMHSELSEALEAARHGYPADDKLPQHSNFVVELADCVIRILNYAGEKDLNLAEVILDKMEYNEGRPHMHGGKKF
jgi:NTP pyrophosphatase (non-canonical NTP hydrolase)